MLYASCVDQSLVIMLTFFNNAFFRTADQSESFAIPQKVSTSALRRSSRSAAKRPALESVQSVMLNVSVDDRPSVERKAQTHVGSTPVAAVRHPGDLQFGSTLCTPISVAAGTHVSSPTKISLSALRPGTPRPPKRTTTSSSKKRTRTPLRWEQQNLIILFFIGLFVAQFVYHRISNVPLWENALLKLIVHRIFCWIDFIVFITSNFPWRGWHLVIY